MGANSVSFALLWDLVELEVLALRHTLDSLGLQKIPLNC